jgi:hypothetical protein
MMVFIDRPISCTFVVISALLVTAVTWSAWRSRSAKQKKPAFVVPETELAVNE